MGQMRIMWSGLQFEGGLGRATYTIGRDGIRGLLAGGAGFRRQDNARPSNHGDFSAPSYRTGRRVSWEGDILTDSPSEQEHAIRRLEGAAADGSLSRVTFASDQGSLWGMFGADSEVDTNIEVYGSVARYRLEMYAPNPRLFGEVRDYGAGVPAVNYGNFEALPRLMVGAGSGGYTVTGPSGRTIVAVTPPTAAHYIDFMAGGMFTGAGVRIAGAMTTFRDWVIPPGMPSVSVSITGARSISQRVTDTFI